MEKTEQKMPWKEFFSLVKSVIPSKILLIVAILLSALSSGAGLLIHLPHRIWLMILLIIF